jgi:excisionase family DNA binding protein
MDNEGIFISVAEAAELLRLDKRTIHRQISTGKFETVYKLPGLTGSYLLARQEVESKAGN